MILPDKEIHRRARAHRPDYLNGPAPGCLVIDPFIPENVQPATIDLTLDNRFRIMRNRGIPIDPFNLDRDTLYDEVAVGMTQSFSLEPDMFVLGSTVERFEFPSDLAGRLEGKSSLARLGLVVHSTAGFFDPGFQGTCTLEFSSSAPSPILLWPGMKIAHMSFHVMERPCSKPYGADGLGSKYQGQDGPEPSHYDENVRV